MSENTEPKQIIQGDSSSWEISLSEYPAGEGWALSYALVKDGALITIPSTPAGDNHLITLTTSTTAAYMPGVYMWTATVTNDTQRRTIKQGMIEVLQDLSTMADGGDLRSQIKRTLDALEEAIERHASSGVLSMSVAGRTTTWRTFDELLAIRDRYASAYHTEQVRAGHRNPTNRILVRF